MSEPALQKVEVAVHHEKSNWVKITVLRGAFGLPSSEAYIECESNAEARRLATKISKALGKHLCQ